MLAERGVSLPLHHLAQPTSFTRLSPSPNTHPATTTRCATASSSDRARDEPRPCASPNSRVVYYSLLRKLLSVACATGIDIHIYLYSFYKRFPPLLGDTSHTMRAGKRLPSGSRLLEDTCRRHRTDGTRRGVLCWGPTPSGGRTACRGALFPPSKGEPGSPLGSSPL